MHIKNGDRYPIEIIADLIWCGHTVDTGGYHCLEFDEEFGPGVCVATNPYGVDVYFGGMDRNRDGWRTLLSVLRKMRAGRIYGDSPPGSEN